MKKWFQVSLQTKIVGLSAALIITVIVLLASIFSYMQFVESKRQAEQLALQAAKSMSFMPEVKAAFQKKQPSRYIQPLAEQVREQIGAASIVVQNREQIIYSHSNQKWIGKKNKEAVNDRALLFGGYYTLDGEGTTGPAIMGKAPIVISHGKYTEVVGVVTVEFLKSHVHAQLITRIQQIILFSLAVLLLGMIEVLDTGIARSDQEIFLNEKTFILNLTPIIEHQRIVGVVASFRDKTELKSLINTISEVRRYSEDLRAQTHEFTNKLYVLSGLLQLGQYKDAFEFIQKESAVHQTQNRILFDQILDSKVQAILLGKIGKASEKKIHFSVDSESTLDTLPEHIEISHLIIIIGNLIDNAFEAVSQQSKKEVSFFITDIGHDLIIEVMDNGPGISEEVLNQIFTKGFSTKGTDRGYGLANIKKMVDELGGSIEVYNQPEGGAIFSVYLPKN